MQDPEFGAPSGHAREERAKAMLVEILVDAGWRVHYPDQGGSPPRPDLIVDHQGEQYVVELKAAAEGRGDRLIPLWAQGYLQAIRHAGAGKRPLVIVAAPRIAPRVAEQVIRFAKEYAPDAAAGVMDYAGLRRFHGGKLEAFDSEGEVLAFRASSGHFGPLELFSDINQWLLKVLLARELPQHLISAPREPFYNASQLAQAAGVSGMSANRFVRSFRDEGYLHESSRALALVRREDLFASWRSSARRRVKEVPLRFVLRGDAKVDLERFLEQSGGCLGLFAAAAALKIGFVRGVLPHVYVRRLGPRNMKDWRGLVPVEPGESPDILVRQAYAPRSIFGGAVDVGGVRACDILQIWLDVAFHPSRGPELAEHISKRILAPLMRGAGSHG